MRLLLLTSSSNQPYQHNQPELSGPLESWDRGVITTPVFLYQKAECGPLLQHFNIESPKAKWLKVEAPMGEVLQVPTKSTAAKKVQTETSDRLNATLKAASMLNVLY